MEIAAQQRPLVLLVARRGLLAATVGVLLLHAVVWAATAWTGEAATSLLTHWDAWWYSRIVSEGYDERSLAYFPLYPLLVRALALVPGAPVPALGALLSLGLFLGAVEGFSRLQADPASVRIGLAPESMTGWFLFLAAPASYVFHTFHTESLFLVLSLAAFSFAFRGRILLGAIAAGLSALSRSQGMLVGITVGLIALSLGGTVGQRLRRFATVGLVSGALFALFPLYSWLRFDDPLAFVHAKKFWTHASSLQEALRSLWLGNPWQNTSFASLVSMAFFYAMVVALPLVWRRSWPLAAYCGLSLATVLVQGELASASRYGVVLFPALFALGDRLDRLPRWLKLAVLVVPLLALNAHYAWRYARNLWCY